MTFATSSLMLSVMTLVVIVRPFQIRSAANQKVCGLAPEERISRRSRGNRPTVNVLEPSPAASAGLAGAQAPLRVGLRVSGTEDAGTREPGNQPRAGASHADGGPTHSALSSRRLRKHRNARAFGLIRADAVITRWRALVSKHNRGIKER
jgi:hypothetical protein